jgi:Flp pilus assembly secretin CpaC
MALAAALALGGTLSAQTPEQVSVAVKVIEFQTGSDLSTGLSAYFRKVARTTPYGQMQMPNGAISVADLTFPAPSTNGITVFLDRLTSQYGEFELILQALQDQNRAFILSRPRAMVPVGEATPMVIETVQQIPYEDTKVFGATVRQITSFRDAGVYLSVQAIEILDDDGDKRTTHDTFIHLKLVARVNEEGQRISVALDDSVNVGSSILNPDANEISVPELVSREITTDVWVPHGQVLIMGGLFRTTASRNLASAPFLTQAEDMVNATAQRLIPFAPELPVGSGLGSRDERNSRRELVFLVRAERWIPSQTVPDEFGFLSGDDDDDAKDEGKKLKPGDVITDVLQGISRMPRGMAEGLAGTDKEDSIGKQLGQEP